MDASKKMNKFDDIVTEHIRPPIPVHYFDWQAWVDGEEDGPYGWGRTEQEAVDDLKRELIELREYYDEVI